MGDVHDRKTRRRNMQAIKNKNTKPEMLIRKALFREGLRYRLHRKDLPGSPDLTFPKYSAVIQIHGCFWHGHNCHLAKIPNTDTERWVRKFQSNRKRDQHNRSALLSTGWRLCEIWECALRGKNRRNFPEVVTSIKSWLNNDLEYLEIAGERKQ